MKTKYFILVIFTLLLGACSDFLDVRPEGTTTSEGLDYTKAENIFLPVSAAYASLRDGNAHAFNYVCVCEITSDDADKGSTTTDNTDAIQLDNFNISASNTLVAGIWTGFYNVVSAANNALEKETLFEQQMKTNVNKLYTRQCAAEAKVIRAYAYFNLVRIFGNIPIINQLMTPDELNTTSQSPKSTTYQFMENDLNEAIPLLPESYSNNYKGRFSKYTALALKAKIHMYHASFENATANWDSVAVLTDKIMASGRFDLLPDFRTEFGMDGENSKESLLEIQSSTLGSSTGDKPYVEYAFVQGPRNNTPSNMQGWGFCVPSSKLISFYNLRGESVRQATTFLYRGSKTPEGDSIKVNCANPIYNGKVYTPSAYNKWTYNGFGFDHNIRIIRYSDVLLMFAEAKVNGSILGNTSGYTALSAINKVRNRVSLTDLTSVSLQDIWDERRAEFALEEDRFFDLVRTGQAASALSDKGFISGRNEIFPIPTAQLQLNDKLNPNPGY